MVALHLKLLGQTQVFLDAATLPFLFDKRYQLLAYLAYRGDWVNREHLLLLFWPDSAAEQARNTLRQLLKRVRDLPWAAGVEIKGQLLRWQVPTDVTIFKGAAREERWSEALEHYGGPLLENMTGDESAEFSNWLFFERERLHEGWRFAVQGRAEALTRAGWYLEAANLLKRPVDTDGLDEDALKAYMEAVLRAGGREPALKAYRAFTQRLQSELSLTPTTALSQLAQAIETGTAVNNVGVPGVPQMSTQNEIEVSKTVFLPFMSGAFVGRDIEIAEAAAVLTNPDCYLLTLMGPGGVGKTRMAVHLAKQVEQSYPDGVVFVALEALDSASLIPLTIADALNMRLEASDAAASQLAKYIDKRRLLLVLDNFEHLLEGATLVSELSERCPNLTLLITSRASLNLKGEWRIPLRGLTYPVQDAVNLEESQYFDAVRLFVERVKQVQPDFVLGQEDLPHVLKICHGLEGSALGLELAATWAKTLPLTDIADELGNNLDFLTSPHRDVLGRHESIRAVFNYSWNLLTTQERAALSKLSVFVGGATREAANQVAAVSLPVLAALVDKSLIRMNAGRYTCHALINQYAQEKLTEHPEVQAQTEENHALYYLGLVRHHAGDLNTSNRKASRTFIEEDLSNVRSAWDWMVTERRTDVLIRTAFALSDLLERNRQEGLTLFGQAVSALSAGGTREQAVLGYMLVGQVEQQVYQRFDYNALNRMLTHALSLLKPSDVQATVRALRMRAECENIMGHFPECRALLERAVRLARQHGTQNLAHLVCDLALAIRSTNPIAEEFRHFYTGAAEELRALGNTDRFAYLSLIYGAHLTYEGNLDEGEILLRESLRLATALGDDQGFIPYILIDLARAAYQRAAFGEAEDLLRNVLDITKNKDNYAQTTALFLLGRVATANAAYTEARVYILESLRLAWAYRQWLELSGAIIVVVELEAAQGHVRRALELLSWLLRQATVVARDRNEAIPLFERLAAKLELKEVAAAEARGYALTREEIVSQLLVAYSSEVPKTSEP